MGLDMYAYATSVKPAKPVDFDIGDDEPLEPLYYWRKHPNLHGWMHELYQSKGGSDPYFNLSRLELTEVDLDALEAAVRGNDLPDTTGCFFGVSQPEDQANDLEFIAKARKALADGLTVFYDAWW